MTETADNQFQLLSALNEKLSEKEKMYRLLCDTSHSAYYYYDFLNQHFEFLGNWQHFFDADIVEEKDISNIYDSISEEFRLDLKDTIFAEKFNKEYANIEIFHKNKKMWIECETTITSTSDGMPSEKVVRFRDITKLKSQKEELMYMAYYDASTGLYNRNFFVRNLSRWIKNAEQDSSIVSVLFIDIDDFRKINDGYGLEVGDEIVQVFGQFLNDLKHEDVMVSHFSSDIFCVAINNPCGKNTVESVVNFIKDRTQSPFLLSLKESVRITVCIGIAEFPEAATSSLELINCAEIVMFKAKAEGKNRVQYFEKPILKQFFETITMENRLKEAINNKDFVLYFQPQYESQTQTLRGVEALIRWKDSVDGHLISPNVFIPIAEKNGSIVSIGDWVLEESLSIFAKWIKNYGYNLILSINISTIQYKKTDFVTKLMDLLQKYKIDPKLIELEITESILIDEFVDVVEKMNLLREFGIRVSLDDFGTGFSSLSYLKGLPIDTLKIDKSFIDTVESDTSTKVITESIVSMVRKLGFETVAEGVETQEQYDYLKGIDCDNIQGFLLGKPMKAEDIEELLMRQF